jgi:hypothetical protein
MPDQRLSRRHPWSVPLAPAGVDKQTRSMIAADAHARWARSFEWRAVERLPLPAWVVGVLLTAAMIAVYVVLEWTAGPIGPRTDPGFGGFTENQLGFALSSVVAGYALAAGAAIAAGNAEDLAALRLSGAVSGLDEPTLRGGRIAGVIGLLAGVGFMGSVDDEVLGIVSGQTFSLDGALSIVSVSLAFWLSARAAWFTLAELTAVARAVSSTGDLDPLETQRLEPLGYMALRAALLWAGAAALTSVTFAITTGSLAELLATIFLVAVAVGSFVIPVRGVHSSLRAAKHAELARVRTEIRRDREAVASLEPEANAAALRLPGLLAFEARIAAAREWPFDGATLRRFGILLLLPLISWLGGALVERGVDQLLD